MGGVDKATRNGTMHVATWRRSDSKGIGQFAEIMQILFSC
jgi:hypothetical protein